MYKLQESKMIHSNQLKDFEVFCKIGFIASCYAIQLLSPGGLLFSEGEQTEEQWILGKGEVGGTGRKAGRRECGGDVLCERRINQKENGKKKKR